MGDTEKVSGGYDADAPLSKSTTSLFRPEVFRAKQEGILGAPLVDFPVGWSAISLLIVSVFVVAVIFLATQPYAHRETVRGVLRSVAGEVRVIALRDGVMAQLSVADGDHVVAGQVLGSVSTAVVTADGPAFGDVFDGARIVDATRDLRNEFAAARSDLQLTQQRIAGAQERLEAVSDLRERGFMSSDEFQRRQDGLLALRQEALRTEARISQLQSELTEADAARGYSIVAARSGIVSGLRAVVGQTVTAQSTLMSIVPLEVVYRAEVFVPSSSIGFVRVGSPVRLMYEAYPYQRFGVAAGVVESVSATTVAPNDAPPDVTVDQPVYRVLIRLERQTILIAGEEQSLRSGMALSADIVLEERSLLEWLLEPLLAIRARA